MKLAQYIGGGLGDILYLYYHLPFFRSVSKGRLIVESDNYASADFFRYDPRISEIYFNYQHPTLSSKALIDRQLEGCGAVSGKEAFSPQEIYLSDSDLEDLSTFPYEYATLQYWAGTTDRNLDVLLNAEKFAEVLEEIRLPIILVGGYSQSYRKGTFVSDDRLPINFKGISAIDFNVRVQAALVRESKLHIGPDSAFNVLAATLSVKTLTVVNYGRWNTLSNNACVDILKASTTCVGCDYARISQEISFI